MEIHIAPQLPVKIGWLTLPAPIGLTRSAELQQSGQAMATAFQTAPLSEDPIVQQIRLLFRAVGIDPTKYRPSSEALLRRAIKGEPVRSINPVVDINNICSMEYRLPFGCYDAEQIRGAITIRLGQEHEEYTGVAKQISIGGKLCCADDYGPFGSPISDSARTKVTEQTKQILVLVFGHFSTADQHLQLALDRFISLCGPATSDDAIPTDSHLRRGLAIGQPA